MTARLQLALDLAPHREACAELAAIDQAKLPAHLKAEGEALLAAAEANELAAVEVDDLITIEIIGEVWVAGPGPRLAAFLANCRAGGFIRLGRA